MLREFREFINRGNFIELAVGFVMGVAVTGVVTTVVERLIMPAIAVLFGQPDFDAIGEFACTAEGCAGSVGAVLTALVNFLVIAFVLFLIVKAYNRLQRRDPAQPEPEATAEDVMLLREIRDALREGGATRER